MSTIPQVSLITISHIQTGINQLQKSATEHTCKSDSHKPQQA
jgi:hypothetical protein